MNNVEETTATSLSLRERMQEKCDRIAKGLSFTQKEKDEAAREIDRIREANAQRLGVQNIAVDLVREMRNSQ